MPGSRQKRARDDARVAKPYAPSMLAQLLIQMVVHGEIASVTCQKVAGVGLGDINSTVDGFDVSSELGKVAGVGTNGTNPANCRKEIFSRVLAFPHIACSMMNIPLKSLAAVVGFTNEDQAVLLPHLLFSQLYSPITANTL